jgi:AAHS family cis,cis-muconate transporter-like MFS transporter
MGMGDLHGRETPSGLGSTGTLVAVGMFVALAVDGMDLQMLALALPGISRELQLSAVSAGALSTYTLLGMGIGGLLSGWLADRVGRVRVVWGAVLVFSAFTSLIALCDTYWQIAIIRLVSGFGLGAVYTVGTLLAAEYVPTHVRTTVLGTLQAGWAVGFVAAALLSGYLLPRFGWRPLFACAILPGIAALALLWRIPESPSWLAVRRREPVDAPPANLFLVLWRDPAVRPTFLLWTIASIALQFGYYGANTWLPSYLVNELGVDTRNMGWFVAGTYSMTVVGKIVAGYIADIIGRRAVWVLAGVLTAVYLPVLVYAATPGSISYLLLLFGFLYAAPYAVNSTYMAESFPAHVRGTAMGASYNLGRVGATLSPVLIGMAASSYSIGLGIGVLGIAYAVCALVPGVFIREKMFDPRNVEDAACTTNPTETTMAYASTR